ncbi:SLC13 family permease [candidate division CSSED10-310 bacterium]|uniref:SLC13 family permease n=1 Tax=candidate division CSSED10-310 bacterium TaxID=2855610 RepID=A0ABV6Z4E3_UNCC1
MMAFFVSLIMLFISISPSVAQANDAKPHLSKGVPIVGVLKDAQNQPVSRATVTLYKASKMFARTTSQPNGSFTIPSPAELDGQLILDFSRRHFQMQKLTLGQDVLDQLRTGCVVELPEIILKRQVTAGFWVATLIFVLVLVLIATGWLHNTLASLFGMSLIFAVTYIGSLIHPTLYILNFAEALNYLDWNVIFLIMGMMMVIAIVENTGIFQWLAFAAYKISAGRLWLLLPILVIITSVGSAILDNVTTMLLMTPITVRIALTLRINPLAFLIPAVMASNVAGVSTLVGTPTNILIGSFADISFNDFLINQTPGVLIAILCLVIYTEIIYRKDLKKSGKTSPALVEKLAETAKITQPGNLKKAGWVGLGMLILFVFGEHIHLVPSVTALMGATALLVWIRPDIEEMIEAVDWTTLVFFIALFIVVGSIQEVGLISLIADFVAGLVGDNLILAMVVIIWMSALLSTVIANIPFTAAMLPVIAYLTATIPGADTKVLYFCLSVGAAMGGNGSLIGASANMVTAGISERAGYPITYLYFLKKGMPALFITVGISTLWLLFRFLVLN